MLAGAGDDDAAGPGKPWWQMTTDDVLGGALDAGAKQLGDALAEDPFLRSVDQMWNANPLRDVVPVDWAEVARALRTVWMRSLGRPGEAIASAAGLNANLLALGHRGLERGRPALVGRNGGSRESPPAAATSGSPRRSGTRTPSTAR